MEFDAADLTQPALYVRPDQQHLGQDYRTGREWRSANLTWHGDGSANYWNNTANSTIYQNWFNAGIADYFYDGDSVLFNDIGSNTPSIYLTTTVSPASVTVNSTQDYDFAGSGLIAGPAT